ncbi:CehA/McbA family metallohydrolase [Halomarina pelagica]|uniref:CehA/McbA family metallohydrolase n=1 Tax=Halomarina pelagica TaxID=2961599 RepID=UPI0020C49535|nr:CehA/McbA family metallohydrolase [Halomarina sp. BND7]
MTRRLAVDPHVHSAGSYDATGTVEEILTGASAAGLDALAVTDHDAIERSLRAVELAPSYGLLALPGVEVSTADGHLLALGVDRRPPAGEPLARTVERVRERGGVAVVPHPFERLRHGAPAAAIDDCDGVETYNACSLLSVRRRAARRFAAERGHARIGGSDAHTPAMVGRAYTEVLVETAAATPDEVSADAVLDAIRRGATRVRGRRTPVRRFVRKYATNARLKTGALFARRGVTLTRR